VLFFIIGCEKMINTKIYKAVYSLAEKLMEAARKDDQAEFESLYGQLKIICTDNDNTDKDHPEQWETLADFTEDLEAALVIYEKAQAKALAINAKDHLSSIGLSMAKLQVDLGQKEAAIKSLESAQVSAKKIEDKQLKAEIDAFLEGLLVGQEEK
jgi:tetratricopeptide (TPR) repeat protein